MGWIIPDGNETSGKPIGMMNSRIKSKKALIVFDSF